MAADTRSLPTDSPVPYFQPLERGHVSEGVPSDIGVSEGSLHGSIQVPPCHAKSDVFPYLPLSSIEYNPRVFEQDRLSTYTGLDDCDTLFEARHGRGAIDNVPKSDEGILVASTMVMPTTTSSMGMTENIMIGARPKHTPDSGYPPPIQRRLVSVREIPSTTEHRVVSPLSTGHIMGEGAAIFTDMKRLCRPLYTNRWPYQMKHRSQRVPYQVISWSLGKYLVMVTLRNPKLNPYLLLK